MKRATNFTYEYEFFYLTSMSVSDCSRNLKRAKTINIIINFLHHSQIENISNLNKIFGKTAFSKISSQNLYKYYYLIMGDI